MVSAVLARWLSGIVLTAAVLMLPALAIGADVSGQGTVDAQTVDVFSAIKDGQINVQLIFKDSTQGDLLIKNKTDKPLNVKLPDVFAGAPVLAQGMGGAAGGRGGAGGGRNQGMMGGGGGMGGGMGGMGGGMGGMGGGMFNIPPEKVGVVKCPAVCLDHGKKDPRPAVPYQLVPIEQLTDKPAVLEVGRMLANGQVNQRAAQAATWHLQNGLTWEQLAGKQLRFANGTSRSYFSPMEIQAAMQITATAVNLAERHKKHEEKPASRYSNSVSTN